MGNLQLCASLSNACQPAHLCMSFQHLDPAPTGGVSPPLGPLVFPNQASFHPAILQFLFGTLGQQPQGQLQGQPQGQPQDQQAQEQGLPQPLQLNHFMLPYHQAFVQVATRLSSVISLWSICDATMHSRGMYACNVIIERRSLKLLSSCTSQS